MTHLKRSGQLGIVQSVLYKNLQQGDASQVRSSTYWSESFSQRRCHHLSGPSASRAEADRPAPPPTKGSVPFSIHYSLPAIALALQMIDGKPEVTFRVAAIVINHEGRAIGIHAEQVTVALNEDVV